MCETEYSYIQYSSISYVTESLNLFNALFLLIPAKVHLKVTPFALNIAIFLMNEPLLINHDIYY